MHSPSEPTDRLVEMTGGSRSIAAGTIRFPRATAFLPAVKQHSLLRGDFKAFQDTFFTFK